MSEFASAFLYPPFPFLLLLIVGMGLRRYTRFHRAGRRAELLAIIILVLSVVPLTAKLALLPALRSVARWHGGVQVGAVVAPTAGAFEDIDGKWRPSFRSIQRVGLAVAMREELGVPLLISGGSLREDGSSEARIVAESLGIAPDQVWLYETAQDTHENARALAAKLRELRVNCVLIVTSLPHMPRMAASMRANGLKVYAMSVPSPEIEQFSWWDLVPSSRGLGLSRTASQVYGGLLLYMLRGWILPSDLISRA